jgi:hypothetical protein
VRALIAVAVVGCSGSQTECERTGVCVTVEVGGTQISAPPPLVVGQRFQPPVAGIAIASSFGPRWKASESRNEFHLGVDYTGDLDTPLLAIGDGVVYGVYPEGSSAFPNGGNVVVIQHAMPEAIFHGISVATFYAVYMHTRAISVRTGDAVVTGQQVAAMGMSGNAETVHLHFETRVGTECSQLSSCGDAYDPHVHPFLFVASPDDDVIEVQPLSGDGFGVRLIESRSDLDFDVIESDLGTLGFDERRGIDVTRLDDFDYGLVRVVPQPFNLESSARVFDLFFDERPSWLELRDIHGNGIRF